MADKRKQRIRALMAEEGISYQAASNLLAQRAACQRAGHQYHERADDKICTLCGDVRPLEQARS